MPTEGDDAFEIPMEPEYVVNCGYQLFPDLNRIRLQQAKQPEIDVTRFIIRSRGYSFTPRENLRVAAARLEAELAKGVTGFFQIFRDSDQKVISRGTGFTGEGASFLSSSLRKAKRYRSDFSTSRDDWVELSKGVSYSVAYWVSATSSCRTFPCQRNMFRIYDDIETTYPAHQSGKAEIWADSVKPNGQFWYSTYPNSEENMGALIDLCVGVPASSDK